MLVPPFLDSLAMEHHLAIVSTNNNNNNNANDAATVETATSTTATPQLKSKSGATKKSPGPRTPKSRSVVEEAQPSPKPSSSSKRVKGINSTTIANTNANNNCAATKSVRELCKLITVYTTLAMGLGTLYDTVQLRDTLFYIRRRCFDLIVRSLRFLLPYIRHAASNPDVVASTAVLQQPMDNGPAVTTGKPWEENRKMFFLYCTSLESFCDQLLRSVDLYETFPLASYHPEVDAPQMLLSCMSVRVGLTDVHPVAGHIREVLVNNAAADGALMSESRAPSSRNSLCVESQHLPTSFGRTMEESEEHPSAAHVTSVPFTTTTLSVVEAGADMTPVNYLHSKKTVTFPPGASLTPLEHSEVVGNHLYIRSNSRRGSDTSEIHSHHHNISRVPSPQPHSDTPVQPPRNHRDGLQSIMSDLYFVRERIREIHNSVSVSQTPWRLFHAHAAAVGMIEASGSNSAAQQWIQENFDLSQELCCTAAEEDEEDGEEMASITTSNEGESYHSKFAGGRTVVMSTGSGKGNNNAILPHPKIGMSPRRRRCICLAVVVCTSLSLFIIVLAVCIKLLAGA